MAIKPWAKRMQEEVDLLPETLAQLRSAAGDIKRVAEDLTHVSARLRQVTEALDAAGLEEATTMIQRSGEAMRISVAGMEAAQRSIVDLNQAVVGGLAKLPGGSFLEAFRRPPTP